MKDVLKRLVDAASDRVRRLVVREYLQARILEGLQHCGAMVPLAFHGGTALRFLYRAPRFSEDLDFALEGDVGLYDLPGYLDAVAGRLRAETYAVETRVRASRTAVDKADIRFPGLLYEMGLSPHSDEIISIKMEVDTRPPAGAGLEVSVVRVVIPLRIQHHDPATLLAGKLAAVLTRTYTKGRDLYDLMWYVSDRSWPAPNLEMLNASVAQSGWTGPVLHADTWRSAVLQRLRAADWAQVQREVRAFLEEPREAEFLTLETFESLLQ